MKRQIVITRDGSTTIQIEDWNEQYHSMHGAVQESVHVFINSGLKHFQESWTDGPIKILEFGFGTGLNALLTCLEADQSEFQIAYSSIEAFPVSEVEINSLNYDRLLKDSNEYFVSLHEAPWETEVRITPNFSLRKVNSEFKNFRSNSKFNLIYYDAFGARVQPELWTKAVFETIFKLMDKNAVLVTYSSKGSVRRAMEEIGYQVERLKGPPGKRHMLRACLLKSLCHSLWMG